MLDRFMSRIEESSLVQHSVLSVSSLYEASAVRTPTAAIRHQLEASQAFRETISTIDCSNWVAVFTFVICSSIYNFYTIRQADEHSASQTMFVLRNAALIGEQVGPWFSASELYVFAGRRQSEQPQPPWQQGLRDAVEAVRALQDCALRDGFAAPSQRACRDAAASLERWLLAVQGRPSSWRDFIEWPASVSQDFVTLIAAHEPMAMIVFVHWCAIMRNAPAVWFLAGWAEAVASSVIRRLDKTHHHILHWAVAALGLELTQQPG